MIVYPVALTRSSKSVTKARCSPATMTRISFIGCNIRPIPHSFPSPLKVVLVSGNAASWNDVPHSLRVVSIPHPILRVEGDEVHPLIMIVVLEHFMPRDQLIDPFARRLNNGEEPHGFVVRHGAVHDRLSRQTEPKIAPRTGHDAEATHDIVINFAAAAVHVIVDG